MRFKSAVVLLLIVVIGTTTFPVTGQEEPLPAIQAKGTVLPLTPSIVLPAEPVAVSIPLPTLEDRARANDFVTFDALYRDAVRRGDSVARFEPLHTLWTYGITNPIGAFYDRAIYERLARAYPSYETFIAGHRIVDSNGNVFYPTSETRTFLLDRALDGTAPSVQLSTLGRNTQGTALRTDSTAKSVWERSTAAPQRSAVAQRSTATPRRSSAAPAPAPRSTATPRRSSAAAAPRSSAAPSSTSPRRSTSTPKRSTAASGTPSSSPAGNAASRRVATPAQKTAVAITSPEPKAAARDTSPSLSTGSGAPPAVAQKAPAVVDQAPAVVAEPTTTSAEPPVVVRADEPPAALDTGVTAPQPIAADNNFGARGLLLLVIGLLGAGLLAMMLRTPRDAPPSIMHPPNVVPPPTGDKPSGPTPVEPLRRPSAAPEPPPPGKNRAGGSHG